MVGNSRLHPDRQLVDLAQRILVLALNHDLDIGYALAIGCLRVDVEQLEAEIKHRATS